MGEYQVFENDLPFPVPNPTSSYWQTPPHPLLADYQSSKTLPQEADYVIVGSGISGASIAYKLLNELKKQGRDGEKVIMLEARQCSSGATGRNGGHCRPGWYLMFKENALRYGFEEARRIELWEEQTVQNLTDLIRDEGINCDLVSVETVDTSDDPKWLTDAIEGLIYRDEAFKGRDDVAPLTRKTVWLGDEAREKLKISHILGAIAFPGYTLSAYKCACGIIEKALDKGLELYTHTEVGSISRHSYGSHPWQIKTSIRGHIRAKNVILATNAYTAGLIPELDGRIIPTRAQIAAIRPGDQLVNNPVLRRSCNYEEKGGVDAYMQSRAKGLMGEGDLIVGGGRPLAIGHESNIFDDGEINPVISRYLTTTMEKWFGKEQYGKPGRVIQEWTGIMGYTSNSFPYIGEDERRPGLWISAGFNGHGMGLAFQASEALVQTMMGHGAEVDTWMPEQFRLSRLWREESHRFPPMP